MVPDKKILILTPFRNEDHSFRHYIDSLKNLTYPHNLISIYWLEQDSSDNTLKLLQSSLPLLSDFANVDLQITKLLDKPAPKQKPGEYYKDIIYGSERVGPWLKIWNEYFIPKVNNFNADYVLIWFADAVIPPNTIEEFLKVYEQKQDAGWVGGIMYRRHPMEERIISPWRYEGGIPKEITKVPMCCHVWQMRKDSFNGLVFGYADPDMHFSIINHLEKQGLYCYCQPTIYIKHVSTDGKIHK